MTNNEIQNKIEQYSSEQRANLRANAERRLRSDPSDLKAQQILEALESFERVSQKTRSKSKRLLEWEPHGHSMGSRGHVNGKPVATISKLQTHTHTNDEIYGVEVMGENLAQRFRYIADARNAAEKKYREKTRNN